MEQLFRKNWNKLRALGIDWRGINTIKFNGYESFSHRVIKFILCHLIYQMGHNFKTEQPIKKAVCDVIDLDTFVVYEIECNPTPLAIKRKMKDYSNPLIQDLIILDLRKMNIEWEPIFRLRDEIKKYSGIW